MSTDHTPGRVTFREDGDANHWSMLTEDGRWLLAILHNGESPSERQVANFRRLAACWNACENASTEDLEALTRPGDVSWACTIDRLVRERDELLAALELLTKNGRVPPNSAAFLRARAAIAKVKGGAA